MKRSLISLTDLTQVQSIYIPREETCCNKMYQYFYYYCSCIFRGGI